MLAGAPLLTYLRYDVDLRKENVQKLEPELTDDKLIKSLSEMDAPENMKVLHRLGVQAAKAYVNDQDFAAKFDMPPG